MFRETILPALATQYETFEQHRRFAAEGDPAYGLFHFGTWGSGPSLEVVASEFDENRIGHYQRLQKHLQGLFEDCAEGGCPWLDELGELTDLAYENDHAVRESGFDITGLYGPWGIWSLPISTPSGYR